MLLLRGGDLFRLGSRRGGLVGCLIGKRRFARPADAALSAVLAAGFGRRRLGPGALRPRLSGDLRRGLCGISLGGGRRARRFIGRLPLGLCRRWSLLFTTRRIGFFIRFVRRGRRLGGMRRSGQQLDDARLVDAGGQLHAALSGQRAQFDHSFTLEDAIFHGELLSVGKETAQSSL